MAMRRTFGGAWATAVVRSACDAALAAAALVLPSRTETQSSGFAAAFAAMVAFPPDCHPGGLPWRGGTAAALRPAQLAQEYARRGAREKRNLRGAFDHRFRITRPGRGRR